MNTSSIGADSPRWWWPSAAAGAVGAAAIAAILVLPTNGSAVPRQPSPDAPPFPTGDPWVTTIDPRVGLQCFALPARWNASLEHGRPSCGHGERPRGNGVRRPGLDSRP